MKKYLKNIISALAAAVLASAGGVCALAAADIPEVPYGEAVIDGVKDECYNDCEELSTDVLVTGYTNYDGSRAKIWLTWDYNGLNVYAEVFEKNPCFSINSSCEPCSSMPFSVRTRIISALRMVVSL